MAPRTWVLLRGLTRGKHHWGGFVTTLQAALPEARILALDLPGNGDLVTQRSPASIAQMATHARQQVQALGLTGPISLFAVSMGGMVATYWAQHWPDDLGALVLINTSLRPFSRTHERLKPSAYSPLLKLLLMKSPQAAEANVLKLTTRHPQMPVLAEWVAMRERAPVTRANALRQLLASALYRAGPQAPAMSTLVLASRQDGLVSHQCSEALARAWQCAIKIHPTAGHDLTLDAGDWVASELVQYFSDP